VVTRLLAVAHQTAETGEFLAAVRSAAQTDHAEVVLLVPATPVKHLASWTQGESRAIAHEKAEAARRLLVEAGVDVVEARVGDPDPYQAILDATNVDDFDRIVVSTFPPGISRWLGTDLINRLGRSIDVPVTHVVAH
jgi:nucleotide-binding universal stress UspA family protein